MRKNKRVAACLLSCCCVYGLIAGYGSQIANAATTKNITDAKSSYENVLKNPDTTFNYNGEKYTAGQFSYYAYVDIDQDGTNEMILSTTPDSYMIQDESALVVGTVDGKVVPLFHVDSEAGAELKLDKADAALTYYYRGSGEQHAEVYQLNDGEFNKCKTLDYWGPYHYDNTGDDTYHIDSKKVSEERFNEEWSQYYENAETINYKSIR